MSSLPFQPTAVQSFAVQVRLARGLAPSQEAAFQRRAEAWLADRALQPLGVQFRVGAEGITSFEALLAADLIKTLSGQCALLLSPLDAASLPPELLAKSQLAGCQVMDDSVLHVRHDAGIPDLLPSTQWIDGNWFLQPPSKPKGAQAASRVMALKLVQLVSTDADTHEIEDVFRQDPTLSYHLLRLVNSLAFGAPRRISSFSQAILMLGRQQLKRWLNLILFASGSDDPRAPMLLGRVVVRARMMELLTRESGGDKAQQELAFMAGMFSLLGVLFGQPLEEVVGSALAAVAPALAGRPVKVRLAEDLPLLHFDAALIERVLVNLLENAAKYTPAGSAIEIGARPESGDVVCLTVDDHGPGLPRGREEAKIGRASCRERVSSPV